MFEGLIDQIQNKTNAEIDSSSFDKDQDESIDDFLTQFNLK